MESFDCCGFCRVEFYPLKHWQSVAMIGFFSVRVEEGMAYGFGRRLIRERCCLTVHLYYKQVSRRF